MPVQSKFLAHTGIEIGAAIVSGVCRGSEMHEATRRLLGVLLRHLDGFETNKRSVVIAATNRKEDLDPALLSR